MESRTRWHRDLGNFTPDECYPSPGMKKVGKVGSGFSVMRNLERMNPLRGILSSGGLKQPSVMSSKERLDEFAYDWLGRKTVQKCNDKYRVG
jgi:hypothetical protein